MTSKDLGNSIKHRLLDLSGKLGTSYQNLETVFLLERFVARLLADETISGHLVFKGGFVGMKVYGSPRHTTDVDAIAKGIELNTLSISVSRVAESDIGDGAWFRFDSSEEVQTQGEYTGTRLSFRAGIGEVAATLKKVRLIHFDIGTGDPVIPGPITKEFETLLPAEVGVSWQVYPIETIVAEKIHALLVHGDFNSRAKDIHDLALFLPSINPIVLLDALRGCFDFRKTELPQRFSESLRGIDTKVLKRGWTSAVASLGSKPDFNEAFESIVTVLKALDDQHRDTDH